LHRFINQFKILDFLVFVLLLAAGVFLCIKTVSPKGSVVRVEADEKQYEYSLEQNGTFQVQGALGYTTFTIENGRVHIVDSACPNKTCVEQGWTSPIVCLPNKVIITIEDYGEFDAVCE